MQSQSKYTPEELTKMFLTAESKAKVTPKGHEFKKFGLPDVGYYKRAFGTYGNFLRSLGRDIPIKINRKKDNPKRFFYPQEWVSFINKVTDEDHKFWFEMLLHTGARYNEIKNIKVRDINFIKEFLFISKPKGGRGRERTIQISTYLKNKILIYIKKRDLQADDTLILNPEGKPLSNVGIDKQIKKYAKECGINDWQDFSCHNFRKTTEMWLIALGINHLAVIAHIGHTIDVASTFYVSTSLFTSEDKTLIKTILGNLLQK